MVKQLQGNDTIRILLTPNRSLSWRGNLRFLLSLVVLSLVVMAGMVTVGAWVVLPFFGLELSALAGALYYTARRCRQQEVLVVEVERLRLEKGIYRKQAEWAWPRRYTRVLMEVPRHPWTPPALYLSHRDTRVALAPFLNLEDTRSLVRSLERLGFAIECRRQPDPL